MKATSNHSENLFGHPKGLFYLFFAELWERFSFYGMRALLILYMTNKLLYSDSMSIGIYAAYGSLVYVTPLIGGFLADKILGYRKAIMMGGILMAIGHFLLSFEHPVFFYTSLAIIIIGNGFFKPNISSFVGKLYPEGDERRDAGFTIFYLGINLGGMLAPLLCAWLALAYGWHFGFGLAGLGMLIGLLVFYRGIQNDVFGNKGTLPDPISFKEKHLGLDKGQLIWIASLVFIPIFALLIRFYQYEHYLVILMSLLIIVILVYILRSVSKVERQRLMVAIYFTSLATLFWAIFEQTGSSLTLFADRNIRLIAMNASQTNSLNSGFIILLALPFSALWAFLNRKKWNINSPFKFGIGLVLLGFGYIIFALSGHNADSFAQTPMFFLVLGYFVLTLGEMFLSPIGLSKMTELSPQKYISFMMGVWFVSSFYGHFFAGKIAQMTTLVDGQANFFSSGPIGAFISQITGISYQQALQMDTSFQQLQGYVSTFAGIGSFIIVIGCLVMLSAPIIKKWMHGIE